MTEQKKATGVYLEDGLSRVAKAIAALEHKTLSALVSEALRDYIQKHYGEEAQSILEGLKDAEPQDILRAVSDLQMSREVPEEETLIARVVRLSEPKGGVEL